tara:strand:+ start:1787 stop:2542 length:756 start_codon:yes stop_codon:yes gene_type:complete
MKNIIDTQKQTAIKNRDSVSNILDIQGSIVGLRSEALNWNDKTTSELYTILYKCLLLVEKITNQSKNGQIRANAELDILINDANFETKSQKLPNKIVQLVFNFNMDRKLVSKYANVLNRFIDTKKSETEFVSWLSNGGGINGVLSNDTKSTKNTASGLTAEEKLSTAIDIVSSTKAINIIENEYEVDTDKPFVLYCVPTAEGKLAVKKVVTDEKFIKPITASFYDVKLAKTQSDDADVVENKLIEELRKAS